LGSRETTAIGIHHPHFLGAQSEAPTKDGRSFRISTSSKARNYPLRAPHFV